MSNIILKAENISKQYRLGLVGTGTLSHDLNRWWHKVRGKEDPYLKIGAVNDRSAQATDEYVWALQDINFEVQRGEVLGIIGKNGAGKSTLLKILSRVTSPTTGVIKTRGRIASLLEVGTGFHPELTGRENIFLNGAILGMTKSEIRSKIDEIVDFSGCEMYIDTPVKRYSSGMRVRLGFAVAAHLEPDILVVDEVLAVGDAEFQKKAIGKMQDVSRGEGRTILFVSHNMAAVQNLCTTGILLQYGRIEMIDSVEKIIDLYLKENTLNKLDGSQLTKKYISNYSSYISSIQLENCITGESQTSFKMGEQIKVRIKLELLEKLDDINLNIRLNDSLGNGLAAWRTSEMGINIPYGKKKEIELVIKDLNIFEGIYFFSIALLKGKTTIDFIENIVELEIIPSVLEIFDGRAINKSNNLIYTPAEWIVN